MFRLSLLLLVGLFSAAFCRSEVRQAGTVDEATISDEIQESKARRAFFVPTGAAAAFREKYLARFGLPVTFVTQKNDQSVFLLNKGEDKDSAFAEFKIREAGKYPPFVFFDPTYGERLARGFTSLEDLMAGYKDPMLNEALLAGIVQAYPNLARLEIIGTTGQGRNITALQITNFKARDKRIALLFSGAMHGNELTATEHCYHIIYEILKNPGKYAAQLDQMSLWIVPIVNPDGNFLFWHATSLMGRKNASLAPGQNAVSPMRGVDLNRNFPFRWNSGHPKASSDDPNNVYFRGPAPGSEKETQAMMQLAERERFIYSISFHAVSGKILVPYTIENTRNPKPDYAWDLAREIAPKIRHHNAKRGFRAVKNIYPVDGTDQDYLYFKYGTFAYILESSYRNCEYRYVPYYLEGYQPLWETLMANYGENYKFALKVTDAAGNPIEAVVRFSDAAWYEGEAHTSNPADGTFFRVTKNTAAVDVAVSARGYETSNVEMAPQGPGYPAAQVVILKKKGDASAGSN